MINRLVKRARKVGSNTRLKPMDVVAFRAFMFANGLKAKDVAKMIGRDIDQVTNVLSGNKRSWPISAAINRAYQRKFFLKPSRSNNHTKHKTNEKIRELLSAFAETLRLIENLRQFEAQQTTEVTRLKENGNIDSEKDVSALAQARVRLDLIPARKCRLGEQERREKTEIVELTTRLAKRFGGNVRSKRAELVEKLIAVCEPFCVADARVLRDQFERETFPGFTGLEKANNCQAPTLKEDSKTVLESARRLISHVERNTKNFQLPEIPEAFEKEEKKSAPAPVRIYVDGDCFNVPAKRKNNMVLKSEVDGETLRKKLDLDKLDKAEGQVLIEVSTNIFKMHGMFCKGLFGKSVKTLGVDGFLAKYKVYGGPAVEDDVYCDGLNEISGLADKMRKQALKEQGLI